MKKKLHLKKTKQPKRKQPTPPAKTTARERQPSWEETRAIAIAAAAILGRRP